MLTNAVFLKIANLQTIRKIELGLVLVKNANLQCGFHLQVYFHGPYEVIDMATKNIEVPSGNFLQFYLSALTIFSSERTRSLSVKQRQCRFYYESNLAHFPFYSYAACRMECRIKLAKEFCGCLPHFYRKLGMRFLQFFYVTYLPVFLLYHCNIQRI